MPPSISRSSLSALSRCRCPATSIPIRSFSTTSPLSAIGPESPKFIEVPIAPQPQAIPKSDIKGTLPPPRNVFGRRGGMKRFMKSIEKPSLEELKAFSPESTSETKPADGSESATEGNKSPNNKNYPMPGQKSAGESAAAAEDRIALKRFLESLHFEPGESVNYSAVVEKSLQAISQRAKEIEGRQDRAHELEELRKHAHQLITWPEYFKAVTPEPTSQTEPANDYVAWKQRMAASRRENLRAGLVNLSYRKAAHETSVAHHSREKMRNRQKLVEAPQREDERLTSPTIREAVRTPQTGAAVPDPDRAARVARSAARVQAKEIAREEARRDALHTLYMHARDFIVTEKQLDDKIEEIFTTTPHKEFDENTNIWIPLGAPITVQNMLADVNNTQKSAIKFARGPHVVTGQRMKRVAEELTGGKMD